jgi:hypothetical protein
MTKNLRPTVQLMFRVTPEFFERIEQARRKQDIPPTRTAWVVAMIERGLAQTEARHTEVASP